MLFWAKTSPICEASTDLGLIRPVISVTRRMRSSSEGVRSTGALGDGLGAGSTDGLGPGAEEVAAADDGAGSVAALEVGLWLPSGEGSAEGEGWPGDGGSTAAASRAAGRWPLISSAMAKSPTRTAAAAAKRRDRRRYAGPVSERIVSQAYRATVIHPGLHRRNGPLDAARMQHSAAP